MSNQPLSGIRVLDFTTLLPGPLAGLILAEAGAEVIKVERPGGEEMRHYLPRWGEASLVYSLLNRGKRCITVDLKADDDKDALKQLVASTDIIVEQFRPGVMKRLGLDYETVRATKPDIIYCSITGFGQEGPKAQIAGHDLNYIADTGLLGLSFGSPSDLVVPPTLVADIGGGTMPGGHQHPAGAPQTQRNGGGRPYRHRHDGHDVHVCADGHRPGPSYRRVVRQWRCFADRRLAALPDLPDPRRPLRHRGRP